MLFILTGDVQIGKTRWLQRLVADLERAGEGVFGVVAPGIWEPRDNPAPGQDPFDKRGIDNVLLPEGTVVPFAKRADLARDDGTFDEGSQAAQAELAWHISDAAIAQVNAHFAKEVEQLVQANGRLAHEDGRPVQPPASGVAAPALLVVDELGRLELLRNQGLTEALRLLDAGPTDRFPHGLVVVRDYLVDAAVERFAPAWGTPRIIAPDAQGREAVLQAMQDMHVPGCEPTE